MQSPLDNKIIQALFDVATTQPLSEERRGIDKAAEELFPGATTALSAAMAFAKRTLDMKHYNFFMGALMMLYALTTIKKGG